MLKSIAAANATNAAASSVQVTCCTPISTSGLLHFPSPSMVEDMTNPLYSSCAQDPDPGSDPNPEPEAELKSKLLLGLVNGVLPVAMSMLNFPPFLVLNEELARVIVSMLPSGITSKR